MKTVLVLTVLFGAAPRGEVIELTGDNCIHCRNVAPVIHRLQREGLPIRQVDVQRQPEEASMYAYAGLPTFLVVVDGKVIHRSMGAVSESQLRSFVAKIPTTPAPAASSSNTAPSSPQPSSMAGLNIELGAPTSVPRPIAGLGTIEEREEPKNDADSGSLLPKLFKRPSKDIQEVRGQSGNVAAQTANSNNTALAASVRLNLEQNGKVLQGSGTIIESKPGRTLVLTSGTPFSRMTAETKIVIEIPSTGPAGGASRKYVGKLVDSNLEADVALVEFPCDQPLPTAPIALKTPEAYEKAISIGGTTGSTISQEQVRVTALNKYDGPDTIECTGVPLPGRSGGGLFNQAGELAGICIAIAEDPQTKAPTGGMFCGLKPIHDLLQANNLSHLVQRPAPRSMEQPADAALASAQLGKPRPMPGSEPNPFEAAQQPRAMAASDDSPFLAQGTAPVQEPVAAAPVASGMNVADAYPGEQEMTIIIRNNPAGPPRVIHIHRASPKLRAMLDGPSGLGSSMSGLDRSPGNPSATNTRPGGQAPLAVR